MNWQNTGKRLITSIKKKAMKSNIVLAIVITTLFMLFFWLICPPTFSETNDDLMMASFAYGYMGQKSLILAYINVVIGVILRALLTVFPKVAWYSVLQVATVYVSSTVVCFLFLQKFKGIRAIIPVSFYYIFFGYDLFCSLQFTRTSAIASIAGIMLLFYSVEVDGRQRIAAILFGSILTIWGSMYRFKMFAIACALFVILGLTMLIRFYREGNIKKIMRLCAPFLIIICICAELYLFSERSFNYDSGWKTFKDINAVRDALQYCLVNPDDSYGYPDYDANEELYTSLGITRQDMRLYSSGNIGDPTFLNIDTFDALYDAREKKTIDLAFVGDSLYRASKTFASYLTYPALLLAICVGVAGFITDKKKEKLLILVYECAVFIAFQLYFYYRGRFAIKRVDTSIILCAVVFLVLTTWNEKLNIWDNKKTAAVLSACILLVNVPAYTQFSERKIAIQEDQTAQDEIRSLISSDRDHFYFYYGSWSLMPDVMYDIWTIGEEGCGSNTSSLGTWRVTTPIVKDKWANFGVTNPYVDMVDNTHIYLMCFNSTQLNQVLTHIRQHYATDVSGYLIRDIGESQHYYIYRVDSDGPDIDPTCAKNGKGILKYDIDVHKTSMSGELSISGYVYMEDVNSFATNLYLGEVESNGKETLHYLVQSDRGDGSDNMQGRYSAFSTDLAASSSRAGVNIYCELPDGTLYKLPIEENGK